MKTIAAYALTALAAAIAWYWVAYRSQQDQHQQMQAQIESLTRELANFEQTVADFPRYQTEHRELRQMRERFDSHLYAKQDILELFDQLERQADQYRLDLAEITPSVEELLKLQQAMLGANQPELLSIGLRLSGGYRDLAQYVRYLETAEFFRGLTFCGIAPLSSDDTELSMQVNFRALLGRSTEAS